MGKIVKITCDGCDNDLTYTANCEDYFLVLQNDSKRHRGGAVTAMAIKPPIDRAHYFCGLPCLDHWRQRSQCFLLLMLKQVDQWKDEHGSKDKDGIVRGWPEPPGEIRRVWRQGAEAAALVAFPMERPKRS